MDKRTLGGKKKFIFEPKMPAAPVEEQKELCSAVAPVGVIRKEVSQREVRKEKKEEPGVALVGGVKDPQQFFCVPNNTAEITSEDLDKLKKAPITVEKVINEVKSREIKNITLDELMKKKILLQIPNILPEENSRYIKGKIRIEENSIYLFLVGKKTVNDPVKEFIFEITPVDVGMAQEAYKVETPNESIRRMGRVSTKFISSQVKK